METIANILMAAGAFGAALYCYILAARLRKFQALESGMGSAIAVLSGQVDDLTRALGNARGAAETQAKALEELTQRGESTAARLELLLASMHDLPKAAAAEAGTESADADSGDKRLRFVRRRNPHDGLEAAE